MFRLANALTGLILAAGLTATAAQGQAPATTDAAKYGFGRAPTSDEVEGWDIDVRPDGHGVKKGKGTVAQGQNVFDSKCASCHGTFGESNRYLAIAGGVKKEDLATGRASALKQSDGIRTVGTKLNSAATLWDYIFRAMPWTFPQSLSADETYAVTAYVLNLNEIVPADFELNDGNLIKVPMPNRNGMTTNHGMSSVKGKPDVQGSNCMKDCVPEVKVISSLPDFARNQHGNLAEQMRPLGPQRGIDTTRYDPGATKVATAAPVPAAPAGPNVQQLLASNACTACHAVDSKVVGPGFRDIGVKHKGRTDAEAYLAKKIKEGGQGVWGTVPMPPQPNLKEADAKAIARWILGGAK